MEHRRASAGWKAAGSVLRVVAWVLLAAASAALWLVVIAAAWLSALPLWAAAALLAAAAAVVPIARRVRRDSLSGGAVALLGFAAVAIVAVWLSQAMAHTPPIQDAQGKPDPGAIATLEAVDLNGSRQWLTIRGRNRSNPVLLFLAGGPGGSELPSTRLHLGALEDHFVVVNWDQPGAGKSFSAVPIASLTPDRYVDDALALVAHLRDRFGVDKIYLMGESWGTILGVWLVRDHPELFHAYVGSGQMVNTTENDVRGYELARQILAERGDTQRLAAIEGNGPPPYTEGNVALTYQAYLSVLTEHMAERISEDARRPDILRDAIAAPEYGLLDKVNWIRGLIAVFGTVYPQLADVDLATQAASLDVPVYFLVGRHDRNAMADLAEAYFRVLEAPHKELVWFEDSGHPPLYSEANRVVDVLVRRVLAEGTRRQEPGS